MQCSVGLQVKTACDYGMIPDLYLYNCPGKLSFTFLEIFLLFTGSPKDQISSLHKNHQNLLDKRIQTELNNISQSRPLPLLTICQFHEKQFLTHYEEHQKTISGCCDPFRMHVTEAAYNDLISVSESLWVEKGLLHPQLLVGRQLCSSCHQTLINPPPQQDAWDLESLSPHEFPTLDGNFNEEKLQNLYMQSVSMHKEGVPKSLKPLQAKVVYNLLQKRDVLCILATNYGKSLAQIAPSFIQSKVSQNIVHF
jgi:hypothetical protein